MQSRRLLTLVRSILYLTRKLPYPARSASKKVWWTPRVARPHETSSSSSQNSVIILCFLSRCLPVRKLSRVTLISQPPRLCVLLAMRVLRPKLETLGKGCWFAVGLRVWFSLLLCMNKRAPSLHGPWRHLGPESTRRGMKLRSPTVTRRADGREDSQDGDAGQPVGLLTHRPEGPTARVCGPSPAPDSQDPKRQRWQIYILLRKKASIQQQSRGSWSPRKAFSQPGHKTAEAPSARALLIRFLPCSRTTWQVPGSPQKQGHSSRGTLLLFAHRGTALLCNWLSGRTFQGLGNIASLNTRCTSSISRVT